MEVNNFDAIKVIFDLLIPTTDNFWFGQIIKRRKDNPDLDRSERMIKSYYIRDYSHLKEAEDNIISICKLNHARFYLNPNIRSWNNVALELISATAKAVKDKQASSITTKIDSICGYLMCSNTPKIWVIDCDSPFDDNIMHAVNDKFITTLPTVNGKHILTYPFPKFDKEMIHTNSPTLIYFNDTL